MIFLRSVRDSTLAPQRAQGRRNKGLRRPWFFAVFGETDTENPRLPLSGAGLVSGMLHKIVIPAIVLSASVFAADLTKIPFETAAGEKTSLADFEGKVVLLVNVASKCGFTKQYTGLQQLYDERKDDGLVILGFPCNDFGGQEPGTIEEIQQFCTEEFSVTFPIMAKVHVKGGEQHELYKALTGPKGAFPGDIKWNFGKILIGKDGKPIARFESATKPDSEELTQAVATALEK